MTSLIAARSPGIKCRQCCCQHDAAAAAAAAAGRAAGLQHRGKHHSLVRGRTHYRSVHPCHQPKHLLTRTVGTPCRDLGTGTQLAQYKTNSSGRNRFCQLGHDYFVAAQNGKDSVHFWSWHKVRAVTVCGTSSSMLGAVALRVMQHPATYKWHPSVAKLRSFVLLTQSTKHWDTLLDHDCCIWHACPPTHPWGMRATDQQDIPSSATQAHNSSRQTVLVGDSRPALLIQAVDRLSSSATAIRH